MFVQKLICVLLACVCAIGVMGVLLVIIIWSNGANWPSSIKKHDNPSSKGN